MSGLGEILEENSRLREMVRARDEQLSALSEKLAALEASNERFALHFEFLEKRRQMAAAERLEAAERQSPLFDGLDVAAPPRDPELEKVNADTDEKTDGRTTAKHPRKGRRDVSALAFPRRRVDAPINPTTCERCGLDRHLVEPRVTHRVGWVPGHFTVVEISQQRCQCEQCPKAEVWMAPEPCLIPGAMCDDSLCATTITPAGRRQLLLPVSGDGPDRW